MKDLYLLDEVLSKLNKGLAATKILQLHYRVASEYLRKHPSFKRRCRAITLTNNLVEQLDKLFEEYSKFIEKLTPIYFEQGMEGLEEETWSSVLSMIAELESTVENLSTAVIKTYKDLDYEMGFKYGENERAVFTFSDLAQGCFDKLEAVSNYLSIVNTDIN